MSINSKILPNYTYEEYCAWEGNWEIIEGIPHAKSPMTLPIHQKICANLNFEFVKALRSDSNCNCTVYHPLDVKITENTVVNPDLLIVCQPIEKKYLDFPPALVVEVLSPSTVLKDRNTKFELYQNFGIKYYLIIDSLKKTIEIFFLGENGKYKSQKEISFELNSDSTIKPDLSSIFS